MAFGEGNPYNPTVRIPQWPGLPELKARMWRLGVFDDPTAGMQLSFPVGDYNAAVIAAAQAAARQFFLLSSNDPLDDSDEPIDLGPDAFFCDEFRMYEFKVRRSPRGRSPDWTEGTYAHPGEKARRRDPRRFHYSGTACPRSPPRPAPESYDGTPEKRFFDFPEETDLPPPPTTSKSGSSGVEAETTELKKIEALTVSAEKEIDRLDGSVGSEIKAFLEVTCMSSGKVRRFAAGTEARFALYVINSKLGIGLPEALYIQAVKEGEEPVSFGPNAVLVNCGKGWKLQTVTNKGYEEATPMQQGSKPFPDHMYI